MTVSALASWTLGRRWSVSPSSSVRDSVVDSALRRQLAWTAPAVGLTVMIAAAGGALLHERPTAVGGFVRRAAPGRAATNWEEGN